MTDREIIVPNGMEQIVERAGYAPAVRVGATVFCAGQVGRTRELEVIHDPEAQFLACWENLKTLLDAAGCTFEDVVEMTTYHVQMSVHMSVFREVMIWSIESGQDHPSTFTSGSVVTRSLL